MPTATSNVSEFSFEFKTLTCILYVLFTTVENDWEAEALLKLNLPFPVLEYAGDPLPVVQLFILEVNSPLVINSFGPIENESMSAFLKSAGKSYSLSPISKVCVVLAYNKGISPVSL